MFTAGHFIWLAVITVLGTILTVYIGKKDIPLRKLLRIFGIFAIISELIKLVSCMVMLERVTPVSTASGLVYEGTGEFVPFLLHSDLPLELCSIQLFLVWIAYFMEDSEKRTSLLGFMFPTAILGGIVACLVPGPLSGITVVPATFLTPRMIQFFLYHMALVVLGIAIARSREIHFQKKHCLRAILFLLLYAVASLYANSLLSVAVYENHTAVGIVYLTNILSTYLNPVGIKITTKLGWLIYFGIGVILGMVGVLLVYLPVLRREKMVAPPVNL